MGTEVTCIHENSTTLKLREENKMQNDSVLSEIFNTFPQSVFVCTHHIEAVQVVHVTVLPGSVHGILVHGDLRPVED